MNKKNVQLIESYLEYICANKNCLKIQSYLIMMILKNFKVY